jgi:polyketide synthase 7
VVLLDAVRAQTAIVLGHTDTGKVGPAVAFKELGIDSLMALELRNKLAAVTGLKLPATLAFDHPNPSALARFLNAGINPDPGAGPASPADRLTEEIEGLGARLEDAFLDLADEDKVTIATLLGELQRRSVRRWAMDRRPASSTGSVRHQPESFSSLLDKELD